MKYALFLPLLSILTALPLLGRAPVSGTVNSTSTGKPLPFAQVMIPDLNEGTSSDVHGNFIFDQIPPGKYTFKITHIGYKVLTQEIELSETTPLHLTFHLVEMPISMEEILVQAQGESSLSSQIHTEALDQSSPRDVGDFFKTIAGGSAVKKGGYAQDPSLRGFQRDQLNIQFDRGIKVWGGCPNRMDPPTSHIQAEDLEKIEIIRGPFSVRWGQSLGGIVNLVMKKPTYTETFEINGMISGGYETNGENIRSRVALDGGNENWDFFISTGMKTFGDYDTGVDTVIIPSNYEIKDLSTKVAYNFSYDNRIQFNLRQALVENVDFPALPMDARKDASNIYSLSYSHRNINSLISSLNAKVYVSRVAHVMDNENRSNSMMVEAITDADSDTRGGRLEVSINPRVGQNIFMGVDYYDHGKTGYRERFVKTNPCNTAMHPNITFIDSVWQDASIQDLGTFIEIRHFLGPKLSYGLGARVDMVTARIGEPAGNFLKAYGKRDEWDEINTSGMAILRYTPLKELDLTLSAGRGTRSADIGERFINHLPIGASPHKHFGNPELKPEINHQLELGAEYSSRKFRISTNVFVSQISNYIFAQVDSSMGRVFLPCQEPKVSKVFQNLENARQTGFELGIKGDVIQNMTYSLSAAFTQGDDLQNDAPLPEIPPLDIQLMLEYRLNILPIWVQVDGRWVDDQDRISVAYGENSTPGFTLYNLRVGGRIMHGLEANFSVKNILNTAYHEHLSRNFAKNTSEAGLPLYEPGRNVVLNMTYKF